eukprot:GHVS01008059.1.p1 GENE.GHVS01008059.1~~GHVS01008059.1.p1  ORF type:complete len:162 (-),score=10.29 GHVS01008059.1:510-995(-)
MAMDPFCILKAFGMCKEPPVEDVQPRWWDGHQAPLPPPGAKPRHRSKLPVPPAGFAATRHVHPTASSPHTQLGPDDRRSLTPQRDYDAVVLDTPTELRCFVPEYSLGRPYTLPSDNASIMREQQRWPASSFSLSSRQQFPYYGRTVAEATVGAPNQFVERP